MPSIYLETLINASPQIVFDLSRSVDLHKTSMAHHNEEVIDGIKEGLMKEGDTVTWKATHLFRRRTLKVKLTECNPPTFFADEMMEGDFKAMRHEHSFKPNGHGTLMIDKFCFESPFGVIGKMVDTLFLKRYMTRLLQQRNREIKTVAERSMHNQSLTK